MTTTNIVEYSTTIKNNYNNYMNTGKVKFFDETKGFGFILDNSTGKEYFVHASGLNEQIQKDDEVEFEITEGRKGLNATDVKLKY